MIDLENIRNSAQNSESVPDIDWAAFRIPVTSPRFDIVELCAMSAELNVQHL